MKHLAAALVFFSGAVLLGACADNRPQAAPEAATARITILYDAFGRQPELQRDWGFSALIEAGGKRILFDTGNNPDTLAHNAQARGVDLASLDFVVVSHRHGDHMGGMRYLLAVNPNAKIFAPREPFGVFGGDIPGSFYRTEPSLAPEERYFGGIQPDILHAGTAWPGANVQLIDKTSQIAPGVHLIATVSEKPGTLEMKELSLAIETPEGMIVVVGCSHPGVERILEAVSKINPHIHFLAGGIHLPAAKDPEIAAMAVTLHDTYKLDFIAPGHCTGEATFAALKKAFGERYLYAGLGTRFLIGATAQPVSSAQVRRTAALDAQDALVYRRLLAGSDDLAPAPLAAR